MIIIRNLLAVVYSINWTIYLVTEVNVTASRALAGVTSKLQGLNEGAYTTIEGQVNMLIQQAKDPNNLSALFQGWQAYLWYFIKLSRFYYFVVLITAVILYEENTFSTTN